MGKIDIQLAQVTELQDRNGSRLEIEILILLRDRYNAFEPGGAVERLVQFIKWQKFYQANPEGVVLHDLIHPLEALLPKGEGE